jgi:lysylphosphatidylglycerol synthetase-like protein (DUF2156 family)
MLVGVASIRLLLLLLLLLLRVLVVLLLLLILLLLLRMVALLRLVWEPLLLMVLLVVLLLLLYIPSLRGHWHELKGAPSHLPKVVLTIHGVNSGGRGSPVRRAGCLGLAAPAGLRTRGACERQTFDRRGRWAGRRRRRGRRRRSGRGLLLLGGLLTGVCRQWWARGRRDNHALCVYEMG